MPAVPGLRSPYDKLGRLVYFGRMLDKIRVHATGRLPADYVANLGDEGDPTMFDARCCRFLGVKYADLRAKVLAGESDAAVLAWAEANGACFHDDTGDPEMTLDLYEDGDHVADRRRYTEIFRKRFDPLFR